MWPLPVLKKTCGLPIANTRYRFGQLVQNEPSRFIEEMPEQYLDRSFAGGGARNQGYNDFGGSSAFERMNGGWKSNSAKVARKIRPTPNQKRPETFIHAGHPHCSKGSGAYTHSRFCSQAIPVDLQAGQKVEHQKFGFGEVLKMEGSAHNPIATVKFENNGEKKIMLNYAKLRIIV